MIGTALGVTSEVLHAFYKFHCNKMVEREGEGGVDSGISARDRGTSYEIGAKSPLNLENPPDLKIKNDNLREIQIIIMYQNY